jgi:hypothetical protein
LFYWYEEFPVKGTVYVPKRCVVSVMVSEGRGRLFRRKDDKYLIYVPKDLAEDSMFPFRGASSVSVKVKFNLGEEKLVIEKWKEETE